ncbi:hypothetical protein ABK040_010240 [Willaertia magna]
MREKLSRLTTSTKDLRKILEHVIVEPSSGSTTDISHYIALYTSPEQIEKYFFNYENLYEKLLDDQTGELRKLKVQIVIVDLDGWKNRRKLSWFASKILKFTKRKKEDERLVDQLLLKKASRKGERKKLKAEKAYISNNRGISIGSNNEEEEEIERKLEKRGSATSSVLSAFEDEIMMNSTTLTSNTLPYNVNNNNTTLRTNDVTLILKDEEEKISNSDNKKKKSKEKKKMKILDESLMDSFGLVHTAIQISQYIIHWVDDSLVHISEVKSTNPNAVIEIGELDIEKDTDKIHNLCQIIALYNQRKTYSNLHCNCHHFVHDCLDVLGMSQHLMGVMTDDSPNNQLGKYLRNLRNGKNLHKRVFIHPITKEKIKFKTHSQLDEYCIKLFKEIPNFKEEYPNTYALLKAYDRGFWLGHLKDRLIFDKLPKGLNREEFKWNEEFLPLFINVNNNENLITANDHDIDIQSFEDTSSDDLHDHKYGFNGTLGCPFGDPVLDGSFLTLD